MNLYPKLQQNPQSYRQLAINLKTLLLVIASPMIIGVIFTVHILFIILISQNIMALVSYMFQIDITTKSQTFHIMNFLLTLMSFFLGTAVFFTLLITVYNLFIAKQKS